MSNAKHHTVLSKSDGFWGVTYGLCVSCSSLGIRRHKSSESEHEYWYAFATSLLFEILVYCNFQLKVV